MSMAEALARLHARAFAPTGRGWSAAEFAYLLDAPHCVLAQDARGFALSRVIGDEAELLTLATDPDHRRQGIASRLLSEVEAKAQCKGAARQFLEVAADNPGARALYAGAGYAEVGRRAGYYARPGGTPVDAMVLSKVLRPEC